MGLRKRLGISLTVVEANFIRGGHVSALSQFFDKNRGCRDCVATAKGGIMMV
jgi:hypothetical protein